MSLRLTVAQPFITLFFVSTLPSAHLLPRRELQMGPRRCRTVPGRRAVQQLLSHASAWRWMSHPAPACLTFFPFDAYHFGAVAYQLGLSASGAPSAGNVARHEPAAQLGASEFAG